MYLRLMRVLIFVVATGISWSATATHLRAVQIQVKHECNTLTYKILITVFTDTSSPTEVHGFVTFGDGDWFSITNAVVTPRPDLGRNIGVYQVELTHIYPRAGTYLVNYEERDRSRDILNI